MAEPVVASIDFREYLHLKAERDRLRARVQELEKQRDLAHERIKELGELIYEYQATLKTKAEANDGQ